MDLPNLYWLGELEDSAFDVFYSAVYPYTLLYQPTI